MDKKAEIYRCGKEVFTTKGYKKANINDITQLAGVATGTFYNFYSSKDKLFMEIFLEENLKLKQSILSKVNLNGKPTEIVKEIIYLNNQGIMENPILKEWINRDVFVKIEGNYCQENGIDQINFMYDLFKDLVVKWQEEGIIRNDISAGMIMAMFGAIINIESHKEEIGFDYFPEIIDYISEFIMKGLTEVKK